MTVCRLANYNEQSLWRKYTCGNEGARYSFECGCSSLNILLGRTHPDLALSKLSGHANNEWGTDMSFHFGKDKGL